MRAKYLLTVAGLALVLAGCGGGGGGGSPPPDTGSPPPDPVVDPTPEPPPDPTPEPPPEPPPEPEPPPTLSSVFGQVSDEAWDETAVRKVLRTFAYGGLADPGQVASWADMPPHEAIVEMLTFDQHNPLLAPVAPDNADGMDQRQGTLRALSDFWSSNDPANGASPDVRQYYDSPILTWYQATMSRGLNPFRQKVLLWETNYHMAVNMRVGVNNDQVIRFYDDVGRRLADDRPYYEALTAGAISAAVARQYGHFANYFVDGVCYCNEDFAREYHQLFFGILGAYDPAYHETTTIKNTARALTHMELAFDPEAMDFRDTITFGREYHAPGVLDILNTGIGGNDARQRFEMLSPVAIRHPESQANLPIKIIEGLADHNLDDASRATIRAAWTAMETPRLLEFLRAYAVSPVFHRDGRLRYLTSVDRHFLIANGVTLSNREAYIGIYTPWDLEDEGVLIFLPRHNVFGGQTGLEAAEAVEVFRNNYNRVTRDHWRYRLANFELPDGSWEKNWATHAPTGPGGRYRVGDVAEWLWDRFVADGLVNYGPLERAHLLSLLARDQDLTYVAERLRIEASGGDVNDPSLYDPDRVVTADELADNAALSALLDEFADDEMDLGSVALSDRRLANMRVGQAINFIVATPYMFAEEGGR